MCGTLFQQPTLGDQHSPGAHVGKHTTGAHVDQHTPGAHVDQHTPGAHVDQHTPGAHMVQPAQARREHRVWRDISPQRLTLWFSLIALASAQTLFLRGDFPAHLTRNSSSFLISSHPTILYPHFLLFYSWQLHHLTNDRSMSLFLVASALPIWI